MTTDTKTRKEEALELLALDKIEGAAIDRINHLTIAQVHHLSGKYHIENPGFAESVDACLTLPTPGRYWRLVKAETCLAGLPRYADSDPHLDHEAKTLAIAMLKAFWHIQPE